MSLSVRSIRTTKKQANWPWVLSFFVLFLGAASAYSARWYHNFYNHVTVQELSHEVKHSTFQVTIRGASPVTLQLYQEANATNQPLVFFTSGDGGWSPFCADIAAHIAASGKTVVGFNMKDYLVSFASPRRPVLPEELARDYDEIVTASAAQPGVNPKARVVLAGWSAGAGFSVLVAADPLFKDRIDRVVAISLPVYSELAWKTTDVLIYITHRVPRERVFDAHPYLRKLGDTPIAILNATKDDTSPLRDAQSLFATVSGPKRFYVVKANDHHFEGGQTEFYRDLDEGLSFDHSLD